MKRRELDGCPITSALQMLGDKWTMLVVRELVAMEEDDYVERNDFDGNPPHIEYSVTERVHLLLPLLESLRQLGLALGRNECRDRKVRLENYCQPGPLNGNAIVILPLPPERP